MYLSEALVYELIALHCLRCVYNCTLLCEKCLYHISFMQPNVLGKLNFMKVSSSKINFQKKVP